jgi:hypothetical protein
MKKLNGPLLGSALWLAVLGAGVVIAIADGWDPDDNSLLSTRNELVHGSVQVHELGPGAIADPGGRDVDHFNIGQRPLASYEIVVDGTSSELVFGGALTLDRYQDITFVQSSVPTDPVIQSSRSLRWENTANTNLSDANIRVASLTPCLSCTSARAVYHIRSYETTYSISRFNNSGSQITVLVLANTGPDTVTGHAHFWAVSQTLLGSLPFSLGPKQTLVQNTSALPFAAGVGGTITVANNGRYGDLDGKAVAVEPSTGFTFDTALVPRPR